MAIKTEEIIESMGWSVHALVLAGKDGKTEEEHINICHV